MTMFASKTPRDLNRDPEPVVHPSGVRTAMFSMHFEFEAGESGPFGRIAPALVDPRPEFDHVQRNEPNPILVEFRATLRNYHDKALCLGHYIEYVTHGSVYDWTSEQIAHARRVLERLERLS